jgi:hypothetical protein
MRTCRMLLGAGAMILSATVAAAQADAKPCELFSTAEVTSVTGAAPERGQPDGPDVDEELGATAWTCGWLVGERYFAARVLRFRSPAEATAAMKTSATLLQSFPDGIQLATVPGPGEQAMWGASPDEGAIWLARKGRMMLAVIFAGEQKDPERLREPLRKLLASGLGKLR